MISRRSRSQRSQCGSALSAGTHFEARRGAQQIPAATSIRRWSGHARPCEWVGPYDDEKLGFRKWTSTYTTPTPRWWEAGPMLQQFHQAR